MTKKEKHQKINKEFCEKVEEHYDIDDEMGGRLILTPFEYDGPLSDNCIDYHQSRHTVDCYNNAGFDTKRNVAELEEFIKTLRIKYDLPE